VRDPDLSTLSDHALLRLHARVTCEWSRWLRDDCVITRDDARALRAEAQQLRRASRRRLAKA